MRSSRLHHVFSGASRSSLLAGFTLLLMLAACSQPGTPAPPLGGDPVSITIEPTSATMAVAEERNFNATISGTSNTSVTWSASAGDVVGAGTTITYSAPDEPGTVTLTAASNADPSKAATATIVVASISVTIDPASAEAFLNQPRTFTATVEGTTSTAVTWDLTPGCGGITAAGNTVTYTAPNAVPGSDCILSATSAAAGDARASAPITVHATPQVSFDASPNPLSPGEPIVFTWSLTNPSEVLPLTCEVDTFGEGLSFTYTIEGCGREGSVSTQSHAYPSPGNYAAVFRVLQGGTELQALNTSVRVRLLFVQVSARNDHSLGLDGQGNVWAWGRNTFGQLGDGTTSDRTTPVPVCRSGSTGVDCVQLQVGHGGTVIAGGFRALAMDSGGSVWTWGRNTNGALGDGTTIDRLNPVPVCRSGSTGNDCQQLRLGAGGKASISISHSVAVDRPGNVWAWGANGSGQLGDGTTSNRHNPVPVCISGSTGNGCVPFNIGSRRALAVGNVFSMASDNAGNVWAWGRNDDGQLGDGTTTFRLSPAPVCLSGSAGSNCGQLNIGTAGAMSAGSIHALAMDAAGNVWAWGANSNRQLGDGTTTPRSTPSAVCATGSSASGCSQLNLGANGRISAGAFHSLALDGSNGALAWGRNFNGQLGDGTTTPRGNPVTVCASGSTGSGCNQLNLGAGGRIEAGGSHSLALDGSGNPLAWGYNAHGQLGDGATTDRSNPVLVRKP